MAGIGSPMGPSPIQGIEFRMADLKEKGPGQNLEQIESRFEDIQKLLAEVGGLKEQQGLQEREISVLNHLEDDIGKLAHISEVASVRLFLDTLSSKVAEMKPREVLKTAQIEIALQSFEKALANGRDGYEELCSARKLLLNFLKESGMTEDGSASLPANEPAPAPVHAPVPLPASGPAPAPVNGPTLPSGSGQASALAHEPASPSGDEPVLTLEDELAMIRGHGLPTIPEEEPTSPQGDEPAPNPIAINQQKTEEKRAADRNDLKPNF